MRFDGITALFALASVLHGASAGPVVAKRQDSATPTPTEGSASATSSSESSAEITSATRVLPSAGLIVSTLSNGEEITKEVAAPQQTTGVQSSVEPTATEENTYTFSRTGLPAPLSTDFPSCNDENAKPFCLPNNESTLYVGKTYFATWNPNFFPPNSTVIIKVLYSNDSSEQVWSSEKTENSWGYVAIETDKSWKQGYNRFNLTLQALNFASPTTPAEAFSGPLFTITDEPPRHLKPSAKTTVNKEGLMIGLPVGLGVVFIVVVGLFIGMRKQRQIGLGNIMGRRNRGYGQGKSRRERLGLTKGGKKGAIRLEERDVTNAPHYRDAHVRGDSLGSLVSDDGIRPAPRGGNQFRDEIQRQRTGR